MISRHFDADEAKMLAQLVEQWTHNPFVTGSIPVHLVKYPSKIKAQSLELKIEVLRFF